MNRVTKGAVGVGWFILGSLLTAATIKIHPDFAGLYPLFILVIAVFSANAK